MRAHLHLRQERQHSDKPLAQLRRHPRVPADPVSNLGRTRDTTELADGEEDEVEDNVDDQVVDSKRVESAARVLFGHERVARVARVASSDAVHIEEGVDKSSLNERCRRATGNVVASHVAAARIDHHRQRVGRRRRWRSSWRRLQYRGINTCLGNGKENDDGGKHRAGANHRGPNLRLRSRDELFLGFLGGLVCSAAEHLQAFLLQLLCLVGLLVDLIAGFLVLVTIHRCWLRQRPRRHLVRHRGVLVLKIFGWVCVQFAKLDSVKTRGISLDS